MAGVWRMYLKVLERYPLRTQASTTGVLMAAGDAISQFVIEKTPMEKYDSIRGLRFLTFGLFLGGPMLRGWYLTLDKLYKGSSPATAILKMATDQAVMAPTFLTLFISIMGVMRKENSAEVKHKLKRDFKPILLANYKVWPAVQLVNFYLVPIQHRILVVNVVALGWNTYLAWKAEMKD